jgi:hypothetical protein
MLNLVTIRISKKQNLNKKIVITWADPKDQSSSIWQILLIILSLTLAEGVILCLPLDVSNNGGSLDCKRCVCGGVLFEEFVSSFHCCCFFIAVDLS